MSFGPTYRDDIVRALPLQCEMQAPPPAGVGQVGNVPPANVASTLQIDDIVTSLWDGHRRQFLWSLRRNWEGGANKRPNNLPGLSRGWPMPTGSNYSGTLRRTKPLDWIAGFSYLVAETVTEPVSGKWYSCLVDHTSAGAFDASKWSEISAVEGNAPDCRLEFTTFERAQGALIVQVKWLCGASQSECEAQAASLGLMFYTWDEIEFGKDAIFVGRASDRLGSPAFRGNACAVDTIYTHPLQLADATSAAPGTLGIEIDHEVQDKRPPSAAEDTSPGKTENTAYLFTQLGAICHAGGYHLDIYTNDIDPLNGISLNNGIDENNIDAILQAVDKFLCVVDGDNLRWDDPLANGIANIRRLKHENADPLQPVRPHYHPSKAAIGLEFVPRYGNVHVPISNILVEGTAPNLAIRVVAPGHAVAGASYTRIRGVKGMPDLADALVNVLAGSVVAQTSFLISRKITMVDYRTMTIAEAELDPELIGTYEGGGVVMQGGTHISDCVGLAQWLAAEGAELVNLWRSGAPTNMTGFEIPRVAITGITNGNPAVVTTAVPHGLDPASSFTAMAWIEGVRGMTQVNDCAFTVANVTATTLELSGFNATALPVYAGGGIITNGKSRGLPQKLMAQFSRSWRGHGT